MLDFSLFTPPELPGPSHDPRDVLVHDIVDLTPEGLKSATHVIVGCPQDMGVARNHGRPGAAKAPAAIRQVFYKLKPAVGEGVFLSDLGDLDVAGTLEEVHERLESVIAPLVKAGKKVIVLGGGNDISMPDASAVFQTHPEYTAINLDAHLDMRVSYQSHSGTPYRTLIDSGKLEPSRFFEVGIQPWANSPRYLEDARGMGVNVHTLAEVDDLGPRRFMDALFSRFGNAPLFVGVDMDCIKASDAPGVSASSPTGLSAMTLLRFAHLCHCHEGTALFEITEVNPEFDVDNRTVRLAAQALWIFLYGNR